MKRMIALLLLVVMICTSLCSCSSNTNSDGMDYADEGDVDNIYDASGEEYNTVNNPNTQCDFESINTSSFSFEVNYTFEDKYVFFKNDDNGIIYMAQEDETGKLDTEGAIPIVDLETNRPYRNSLVEMPECFKSYDDTYKATDFCNFLQAVNGYIYWADAYSIWRVDYVKYSSPELVATTGTPLYCMATPFYIKDGYLYTCENSYYSQESSNTIEILSGFVRYNLDTLERETIDVYRVSTSISEKSIHTTLDKNLTSFKSIIYAANSDGVFYYGFCGLENDNNIKKYDITSNSIEDTGVHSFEYLGNSSKSVETYEMASEFSAVYTYDDMIKVLDEKTVRNSVQEGTVTLHVGKTNNGTEYRKEADCHYGSPTEYRIYVNDKLVVTETPPNGSWICNRIFRISVYGNYVYYLTETKEGKYILSRVNINSGEYELIF